MGFSDVGAFGSEVATPNIDMLAREGLSFTNLRSGQDSCKKFRFVQNLTRISSYSRVNRFPVRLDVSIV
jgi:hypothetical protein